MTYRITTRWRTVPPLVDVAHQLGPAHSDVAGLALVLDEGLEAARVHRVVDVVQTTIGDVRWYSTFQNCNCKIIYILEVAPKTSNTYQLQ